MDLDTVSAVLEGRSLAFSTSILRPVMKLSACGENISIRICTCLADSRAATLMTYDIVDNSGMNMSSKFPSHCMRTIVCLGTAGRWLGVFVPL